MTLPWTIAVARDPHVLGMRPVQGDAEGGVVGAHVGQPADALVALSAAHVRGHADPLALAENAAGLRPALTTMPANSWPSTIFCPGASLRCPLRMIRRSVPQMLEAMTWTSNSSSAISGTGTSSTRKPPSCV